VKQQSKKSVQSLLMPAPIQDTEIDTDTNADTHVFSVTSACYDPLWHTHNSHPHPPIHAHPHLSVAFAHSLTPSHTTSCDTTGVARAYSPKLTSQHETARHHNTLQHTAIRCNTRTYQGRRQDTHGPSQLGGTCFTAAPCTTLQHTQHSTAHCNTRQYAATHGHTREVGRTDTARAYWPELASLQHTARHNNTLHHSAIRSSTRTYQGGR